MKILYQHYKLYLNSVGNSVPEIYFVWLSLA